jgi:long-chain fatty acid transport protein
MTSKNCSSGRNTLARIHESCTESRSLTACRLQPYRAQRPRRWSWTTVLLGTLFVSGLDGPQAYAAGFDIIEQSARALGHAFAGEAGTAEDATTIYYNPAGLTHLPGTEIIAGGRLFITQVDFDNHGSSLNPALGGGPLSGDEGPNGGTVDPVPSAFISHALSPRWSVGLGVFAPFGSSTSYNHDWVGRYHADETELKTITMNPAVAFRIIDQLSIGAGLNVQYAKLKFTNALDMGSICEIFAAQGGLTPDTCPELGLAPQAADGFVKVTGDSWSVGYNVGLLFDASEHTRVGVAFRSKVDHTLKGDADFGIPEAAKVLQLTGAFKNTGARFDLTLPETVELGALHEINSQWAVMAGISWTHWAHFDELVVKFDNPHQPPAVQPADWNDTFRYAVGVRYKPTSAWTVRAGTAYSETPVPNSHLRTARVPDNDRYWLALGAGYRVSEHLRFDAGYAHVFSPDASIRNPDENTGHILRGDFELGGDILGLQFCYDL